MCVLLAFRETLAVNTCPKVKNHSRRPAHTMAKKSVFVEGLNIEGHRQKEKNESPLKCCLLLLTLVMERNVQLSWTDYAFVNSYNISS